MDAKLLIHAIDEELLIRVNFIVSEKCSTTCKYSDHSVLGDKFDTYKSLIISIVS